MAEGDVSKYRMVVIGGSAGSLDSILKIVAAVQEAVDVAFVVVVHRGKSGDSILTDLLSSQTKLVVKEVEDKELILPGTIYIAPPDYHLLLENEYTFSLDASEKVHYSRPSIDVTFESAALVYGPALVGVLLSGANADGAVGLKNIADAGGFTIAQQPATAEVGYMPQQAINLTKVSVILEGEDIGIFLKTLLK
ncbi:two-component system, chemotaxis family, response regulator CheB [Chitinophaga rupis]|uniref:protein-glutamate methylesterase n=1 Tax=Chitinophaga rupis TaxID=573321 RepID=A0A1H7Y0V4_9BACT|nr:chemotaxis protein CheB [Chitinophaga rupis]SEM39782.1 two-component system, chemotaxis family, response regulator CheB [Chitinophaga rupis]